MADELDLSKISESLPTSESDPQKTDKCAAEFSDAYNFVELDACIIKDDEFQPLLASLAPPQIDMSAFSDLFDDVDSDLFDFNKLILDIVDDIEPMQSILSSTESDDSDFGYFDQLFCDNNIEEEFESLRQMLAPMVDNKCADNFKFDLIFKHIVNRINHHKRTKDDIVRDITIMISTGLKRGDIRKDQLETTASDGAQRIVELAYWYKIPLRSAPGERIRLQSDTLTFVRAITCFPHLASLLLFKSDRCAKDGAKTGLTSQQLSDAMKHSGFPGLIPKGCDPYLMKAYLFAHTAYMVDLGRLINPGDKRRLEAIAANQLEYCKAGVEKVPYDDEFRVGILNAVGLTDPRVFKKIVDVCNNLCKVVGEPELSFATAEKNHIKNDMVCFFEDDGKDVAAAKDVADKLKVNSNCDPFIFKD